ncbi:FliH/SctL family protein [Denitrobaculum tricleocarpae]|uniref:Uncharacterized protein n=1 Tax=Denitrobaculum tricleocarpae TaxID=2591009 RepID=A0A545T3U7_9PROT|nr:FliH/SctL family protein [Denitrobaculum tricleocarpae]TQV71887.1 hypothetical protein FKG95_26265 [Denitrobaculum tricleocarpae]
MSAGQKFLFNDAFEAPLTTERQAEAQAAASAPPPEPEVVEPEISEADLEQARAEGRQEGLALGREEGRTEAFTGIEQTTQTLLLNLTGRVGELLSEQPRMHETVAEEALKAASTILRKLVPSLEKSAALKEIEAVVSECLERAQDEPRLVVRVSEPMLEPVKSRIDALVKAEGFEGKVVFLATDDLGDSDVRVEWADGGAERRTDEIWRDIDEVLGRFLKVPAESLSRQPVSAPQVQPAVQQAPPLPAAATEAPPQHQPEVKTPGGTQPEPAETPPPLVSPMEQMGLATVEDGSSAGNISTAPAQPVPATPPVPDTAPVAETAPVADTATAPDTAAVTETPVAEPPVTENTPQTLQKPAAPAAGPQEPSHD